jgi:hypothetical protein
MRKVPQTATNHNKRSKDDVFRIENDVRQLRAEGKSGDEIMVLLKIPERTYRRYIQRVCEQDKQLWYSIVSETVYTEFLRLKDSFEYTYQVAKKLSETAKDTEDTFRAGYYE